MANEKNDDELDPIENAKIKAPGAPAKGAQVATARAEQDKAAARAAGEQRAAQQQRPKDDEKPKADGPRQPIAYIAKNTKRVSLAGQFTHITAGKRLSVSAYGMPQIEKIRAQGVELDPVYE